MPTKAPFKLLYNNDATNTAGVISPWHEEGEPFREEMLVASIEEVAGTGVDAYMLSPGMGWVPWWQSNVEPDFYAWWEKRTGMRVAEAHDGKGFGMRGYDKYVYEGGDMVAVLVETCRKRNMAPFVSLRLNDVHMQEYYNRKHWNSLVSCRFYTEHPEWHIDPEHPQHEGYNKRRGMNWAIPEVRAFKLKLLTELASNYDLAGIELDFLRDNTMFREDETTADQRIEIITEFVRDVRAAIDASTPAGARRYLGVRIPQALADHDAIGLDVEALYRAGVDMFNLSGWFHTIQRSDVAEVRKRLPTAAIYQEMTHSTGSHRYFMDNRLYGCDGDPRTSDHQLYTTARLARARGADGMSLFNYVYYRQGVDKDLPVMEPPFHVLPKLSDTAFLARQHPYYMLAKTSYFSQLPCSLAPGGSQTFEIDMLQPAGDCVPPDQARLRLHMRQPCDDGLALHVTFNGQALEATPDVSRFFGNPFDGMISPVSHRRAWTLPTEIIRDGLNMLEVTAGVQPAEIIYVDVGAAD